MESQDRGSFAADSAQFTDLGDDLREVKVKVPAHQVLRLHYARMKTRKNFSELVSTALTRYLDDLNKA